MITGIGFEHKKFNFPCGEMHVQILPNAPGKRVSMHLDFEGNEDIIEMLLVANALKHAGHILEGMSISYVPFSRQDRVNQVGECFSLEVFAQLVNSLELDEVVIDDPHSDVTPALINNCKYRGQGYFFEKHLKKFSLFFLISPDGGALKKIYKLASQCNPLGVVECSKLRDSKTGNITGVKVWIPTPNYLRDHTCIMVDDICDGGRTFIEIAKVLKAKGAGKIVLMVTHGFFTKGIEVFDGLIDEIYTKNGRVK